MSERFAFDCLNHSWVESNLQGKGERPIYPKSDGGLFSEGASAEMFFEDEVIWIDGSMMLVIDPFKSQKRDPVTDYDVDLLQEDQVRWLEDRLYRVRHSSRQAFTLAQDYVVAIACLARDGDLDAVRILHWLATFAASNLENTYNGPNPKGTNACREMAKGTHSWPVNLRFGPTPFMEKWNSREKFNLLEVLGLGKDLVPYKKGKTRLKDDEATRMAMELIEFVARTQKSFRKLELRKSNKSAWAKACIEVFNLNYPNPEQIKGLENLCKAKSNRAKASRHRAAIRDILKKRITGLLALDDA